MTRNFISAPSESADLTVVMGVNERWYDTGNHHIISNASCTTNSLAPAVRVLNDAFGIEYLMVTTVHAYTASQALVDRAARKLRRGRAAAASLIPTSTGAAKATALVIPELKDRMDAIAVRAPIPDGAITDIVADLKKYELFAFAGLAGVGLLVWLFYQWRKLVSSRKYRSDSGAGPK